MRLSKLNNTEYVYLMNIGSKLGITEISYVGDDTLEKFLGKCSSKIDKMDKHLLDINKSLRHLRALQFLNTYEGEENET